MFACASELKRVREARRPRQAAQTGAVLGYVTQLCASGIDLQLAAPQLVAAVRKLVGADWGKLCWPGGANHTGVGGFYSENTDAYALAPAYLAQYGGTHLEREAFGVDFPTAMRTGRGWQNLDLHRERLKRSRYYDDLYRPLRIRHGLEVTAWDGVRGGGSLMCFREAKPFRVEEQKRLAGLSRLIGHGVRAAPRSGASMVESDETGIVLADARGKITLMSDRAASLLFLSLGEEHERARFSADRLPAFLMPLLQRVVKLAVGQPSKLPVMERVNRWGTFTFRAYATCAPGEGPAPLVALHIHRFEPVSVRVLHNAWRVGLTERQREVCLHIAARRSYAQIARIMGVRASTVIDHVRKIYTRLDVGSHEALLDALSSSKERPIEKR